MEKENNNIEEAVRDFCRKTPRIKQESGVVFAERLTKAFTTYGDQNWKKGFQDGLNSVQRESGNVLEKLEDAKSNVKKMQSWVNHNLELLNPKK